DGHLRADRRARRKARLIRRRTRTKTPPKAFEFISSEDTVFRSFKASAVVALASAVAVAGLTACGEAGKEADTTLASASPSAAVSQAAGDRASGTRKIQIEGKSVNVSCSGRARRGRPTVILLSGLGDGLEKMAPLQKTLG